jgi:hypothetical protein
VNDQGLESPDEVRKLGRAPLSIRILGGAALAWGGFLGLGVIAGQVVTQSMFGDPDTVPTLPDWTAIVALVVVGRGLLRSRWWAGICRMGDQCGTHGVWHLLGHLGIRHRTDFARSKPRYGSAVPVARLRRAGRCHRGHAAPEVVARVDSTGETSAQSVQPLDEGD